jgi:hypothetical protein
VIKLRHQTTNIHMASESDTENVIFALNPAQIQVNDIVFISDQGSIPSLIRWKTESEVSHVAICTRDRLLLEAVRAGVMRRAVLATYASRPEWIKVLRTMSPLGDNADGLCVAELAEAMYGRRYSIKGAIASVSSRFNPKEDGSVFCSRLVAQAFSQYGLDLVPGTPPAKIFPERLLGSTQLCDVTSCCVRRLGSHTDAAEYSLVKSVAAAKSAADEMKMNREVFDAIRARAGDQFPASVYSLPDLCFWLFANTAQAKAVDSIVLDVMARHHYFEWYASMIEYVQSQTLQVKQVLIYLDEMPTEECPPELNELVHELGESVATSESALAGRRDTAETFQEQAGKTGLSTLRRLSENFQAIHEAFDDSYRQRVRLKEALERSGGSQR